jgi:16S rRNA (guanine527-N7)-methyltransferase
VTYPARVTAPASPSLLDGQEAVVSNATVLTSGEIDDLLRPFGVALLPRQAEGLMTYLDLLLRWNKKINLTSVTKPEEIIQRHFGESFYLSNAVEVKGRLLDIGSGAGFPGLALKIFCPDVAMTLLEPVAKKRAFLKEVARACQMTGVEVLADRLEDFVQGTRIGAFDYATARAVGQLENLVPTAVKCLKREGRLALWLGVDQVPIARDAGSKLTWSQPMPIPLSNQRVILIGQIS